MPSFLRMLDARKEELMSDVFELLLSLGYVLLWPATAKSEPHAQWSSS